MANGKRFFLYSQHVAGGGHFVRTYEIARLLAKQHEIYLVDGGRPIPRGTAADRVTLVPIPRICRNAGQIVPFKSDRPLADVLEERRQRLLEAIEQVRPDVVMVEHFPFSKWLLRSEIISFIRRARAIKRWVKTVCSVRDMWLKCRIDADREDYRREVLDTLGEYFDLLLVHGDPRVARLDEEMPWISELSIPMQYTGYVSQRCSGRRRQQVDEAASVVVSTGSIGGTAMLACAIQAWKLLVARRAVGDRSIAMFLSLAVGPEALATLQQQAGHERIRVLPFSTDFLDWIQAANLSISNAGYNTCTNILETQCRSILIPSEYLEDQPQRAQRFGERGFARVIAEADLTPDRLADAIAGQLSSPTPDYEVNLNGAETTRDILEALTGTLKIQHFRISRPSAAANAPESPAIAAG